jgi:hypothetical protein
MAQQLNLSPPVQRRFVVSVYGYGDVRYTAASAGKARAQAYRDFCDAVTRKTFHWFLVNSRVWQVTPSAGDGDAA